MTVQTNPWHTSPSLGVLTANQLKRYSHVRLFPFFPLFGAPPSQCTQNLPLAQLVFFLSPFSTNLYKRASALPLHTLLPRNGGTQLRGPLLISPEILHLRSSMRKLETIPEPP